MIKNLINLFLHGVCFSFVLFMLSLGAALNARQSVLDYLLLGLTYLITLCASIGFIYAIAGFFVRDEDNQEPK
jgi:ABC-type polysaccharide/polyol phosphate export permease